jgi:transposase
MKPVAQAKLEEARPYLEDLSIPLPETARLFNVTLSTVYGWAKQLGIPPRGRYVPHSKRGPHTRTAKLRKKAIPLLKDPAWTNQQIAQKLGISEGTVSKMRKELGIPLPRIPQKWLDRRPQLEDKSITIAKRLGEKRPTVVRWMKYMGMDISQYPREPYRNGCDIDRAQARRTAVRLLIEAHELSYGEIAQRFGVSIAMVEKWARIMGVSRKYGHRVVVKAKARAEAMRPLLLDHSLSFGEIAKRMGCCYNTVNWCAKRLGLSRTSGCSPKLVMPNPPAVQERETITTETVLAKMRAVREAKARIARDIETLRQLGVPESELTKQ